MIGLSSSLAILRFTQTKRSSIFLWLFPQKSCLQIFAGFFFLQLYLVSHSFYCIYIVITVAFCLCSKEMKTLLKKHRESPSGIPDRWQFSVNSVEIRKQKKRAPNGNHTNNIQWSVVLLIIGFEFKGTRNWWILEVCSSPVDHHNYSGYLLVAPAKWYMIRRNFSRWNMSYLLEISVCVCVGRWFIIAVEKIDNITSTRKGETKKNLFVIIFDVPLP